MILKIRNFAIGCKLFFKILILANTSSQNTQHGIHQTPPRKRTLELCFLTACFDVTCSCVDAEKDTRTSLNTTSDKNTRLRTGHTSLHCMILNPRINGAKKKLEKQNTTQKKVCYVVYMRG